MQKYYFYLWCLRVKLLQDKILQNVPEHTYIGGCEKSWGGKCNLPIHKATYVPLKTFASKPQKVTFKLSTADASRDKPPICGHAFQPLTRHCPKQPNLEGAHRLPFCARTPCDAAPSLQNGDAIRNELKGRAPTNTMALSCNNQYDKITYVGRLRNH